jgi:hypothetical protein
VKNQKDITNFLSHEIYSAKDMDPVNVIRRESIDKPAPKREDYLVEL